MRSILSIFKKIPGKILPLQFSKEAVAAIRAHLAHRPESAFQVRIERKGKHSNVQVGYDRKKNIKTAYSYPIPVEIEADDEVCLEGSRMEWDAEAREFRIHPDVDLDLEYGILFNRFTIHVNRNTFKSDSARIYQKQSDYPTWFPIEPERFNLSKTKIQGRVWTFDLKERYDAEEILRLEQGIAEEILDYFSEFPRLRD
ncbi:hypothetical protein [Leptospira sanjuanensis]|uniref:hypothetical protein n=1 Tax=Leptospira sanjuanensis TaxID=2879643 RepID=UPI001EE7D2EA|nr:hypothetical protein [Leptospira sanjuanensis]MCG6168904.1 hypothetical protein [Leptospira sanjuanensis]